MTLALEPTKLYLSCKILTGHCPDFAVGTAVGRPIFVFHGIFKGKMAKNLVGMCYNHLVSTAELHFWDTPLATICCMWSDGHKYLYVVFVYIFLVCCLCICICMLSLCGVCSEENCVLLLFTWIALPRHQLAVANPQNGDNKDQRHYQPLHHHHPQIARGTTGTECWVRGPICCQLFRRSPICQEPRQSWLMFQRNCSEVGLFGIFSA